MQLTQEYVEWLDQRVAGIMTLSSDIWYGLAESSRRHAERVGKNGPFYKELMRDAVIFRNAGFIRSHYE